MTDLYGTGFLARLTLKRLQDLNKTRAKSLDRTAGLLAEAALDHRRAELLADLRARVIALGPVLRDISFHVSELKSYLQSVYDADLMGDSLLQELAAEHCIRYTVRLLDLLGEPSKYTHKDLIGVLELASSTLAMFSGRASAVQTLLDAGAVPVIVKLLSPLFPTVSVVNVANAVGSLAASSAARVSFRAAGGVGALVRLLRSDVEPAAQTAAAAALSLLGARDLVVQDSVRYLGGLGHLVDMLSSDDAYASQVAKYTLQSLRHGNSKNQAEIITHIRANSVLIKDLRKLDAAADLLRFEDRVPITPLPISTFAALNTESAQVRALLNEMNDHSLTSPRLSPRAASAASSLLYTPGEVASSRASSLLSKEPGSPLSPRGDLTPSSPTSWRLSSLVDLETELLRKKHLRLFSHSELVSLLEEMGFDSLDLRGFRVHYIDGTSLLDMSEDYMLRVLVLPRQKIRKLKGLQQAGHLFDRIATLPHQGKISETELRLYLSSRGASNTEVNKIVKLFRTLVRTDKYDFVSFWDFVTSYDWIAQALRIYNVPA